MSYRTTFVTEFIHGDEHNIDALAVILIGLGAYVTRQDGDRFFSGLIRHGGPDYTRNELIGALHQELREHPTLSTQRIAIVFFEEDYTTVTVIWELGFMFVTTTAQTRIMPAKSEPVDLDMARIARESQSEAKKVLDCLDQLSTALCGEKERPLPEMLAKIKELKAQRGKPLRQGDVFG